MKIASLTIHNFRSILHEIIKFGDYSLLIGPNNSGKSNVIDAIRVFYETGEKYSHERDFPKCCTSDIDSWVEIEFILPDNEFNLLKQNDGRVPNSIRLRRIFEDSLLKPGLYECTGNSIEVVQFNGKIGKIVYIPAVSALDAQTKMTGPSPLRELVNDVFFKVVQSSEAFDKLKKDISSFGEIIKLEKTEDDKSLQAIEDIICNDISNWNVKFGFKFNSLNEADLVKNIIDFQIIDEHLEGGTEGQRQGQGFQRQLIFTLIRLSAQYLQKTKTLVKSEFAPDFTVLLFEEPEAFLHPTQQDILSKYLKTIASQEGSQVIISSHSPIFVSHNSLDIPSLICLNKRGNQTLVGQISKSELDLLFEENQQVNILLKDSKYKAEDDDLKQDMEVVKYFMWFHPERCQMFFSHHVVLVEGPTERYLFNYLRETDKLISVENEFYILECMGKFNIPRFMNLLGKLKIPHSVLYDSDNSTNPQCLVNELIQKTRNPYTKNIVSFPTDIERFLEVPKSKKPSRKPQHLLLQLYEGKIKPERIEDLQRIFQDLISLT